MKIFWEVTGKNKLVQPFVNPVVNRGYSAPSGDNQHIGEYEFDTQTFSEIGLGSLKKRTDTAFSNLSYIYYGFGCDTTFEKFDVVLLSLSSIANLETYVGAGLQSETDGYIVGKRDCSSSTVYKYNKKYNFVSESWSNATDALYVASFDGGLSYDDTGVLLAGKNSSTSNYHSHYSFSNDSWVNKSAYPAQLYGVDGFKLSEGKYHGVVGNDSGGHRQTQVNEYTISADSWASDTSMPDTRSFGGTFNNNTNGYQLGGSKEGGAAQDTIYKFDDISKSWSLDGHMSSTDRDFGALSIAT